MYTGNTSPPRRKPTIRELLARHNIHHLTLWHANNFQMSYAHLEMILLNMPMSYFFIQRALEAINALTGQSYRLEDVYYTPMPDTRKERHCAGWSDHAR